MGEYSSPSRAAGLGIHIKSKYFILFKIYCILHIRLPRRPWKFITHHQLALGEGDGIEMGGIFVNLVRFERRVWLEIVVVGQ